MKAKSIFLDLKAKIQPEKNLIVTFRIESTLGLKQAAIAVAEESSIGTWTKIKNMKFSVNRGLVPKIFSINNVKKTVKIAYPLALFEAGSIPQLLSSIGGNVFSLKTIKRLRLEDIEFPAAYLKHFPGPAIGIEGIKDFFDYSQGPILGAIIKPKLGLSASQQARLSYKIWKSGIDLIKDDENLTSMQFNKFEQRIKLMLAAKKQAEKVTGQKKIYACNITAPFDVMLKRAKLLKKLGNECAMIDIISVGWAGIQSIRAQDLGLILHGHRAGHSAFTRDKRHGISMLVLAKLARIAGIDQLHTGTVVGKMEGDKKEVLTINQVLSAPLGNLKPVLPIASGGLHPGLLPQLVKILGKDLIINFGGGLHGHPRGVVAGARACAQARKLVRQDIDFKQVQGNKNYQELNEALQFWREIKY